MKKQNLNKLLIALTFVATAQNAMGMNFFRRFGKSATHFVTRAQAWLPTWGRFTHQNRFWKKSLFMGSLAGLAGIRMQNQGDTQQPMNHATVWEHVAHGQKVDANQMKQSYIDDCKKNAHKNGLIPVHVPNNETVRIATYNVHFFYDALNKRSFTEIIDTIQTINADVIVLQEVSIFQHAQIKDAFAKIGYTFSEQESFCKSMDAWGKPFGNVILSKYPIVKNLEKHTYAYDKKCHGEKRCYLKANITLPNDKKISMYGTHLDVYDETETRRLAQINELIEQSSKDSNENIIIAADFNAVRKKDYAYQINGRCVWDMVNESSHRRFGINTPTHALQAFENNQFKDSFSHAGCAAPKWTVWSGTAVDFMYLNKSWNLPVVGSWVYYSTASDHLPVIMDVKVS